MFDEDLIFGERLSKRRTLAGPRHAVAMRVPWYRSMPLSCFDQVELSVDGREIPSDAIAFELNGEIRPFSELKTRHDLEWFTLDVAHLLFPVVDETTTNQHEVTLSIYFRVPYLRGDIFRQVATCSKSLTSNEVFTA